MHAHPSFYLRLGILFAIIGLFLSQFITLGLWATSFCIVGWFYWQKKEKSIFFLLIFTLFGLWGQFFSHFIEQNPLEPYKNQTIDTTGTIKSFPKSSHSSKRATIKVQTINNKAEKGQFLAVFPKNTEIKYGDRIKITGKLTRPRNFDNFNYQGWLQKDGIYQIMHKPDKFIVIETEKGNSIIQIAYNIRQKLSKKLQTHLPQPHATLTLGMLAGLQQSLPKFWQDRFQNAGLTHILVVSGANVAILVLIINSIFGFAGKPFSIGISLLSILLYTLLTGAESPVLRASFMGGIAGFATILGKKGEGINLVLISLLLLSLFNPPRLWFDVGLHLSAIATLGLLCFTPYIQKKLHFITNFGGTRQIIATSLAAEAVVLPFSAIIFDGWAWAGVLANIFAEPFMPLILFWGIVSSILLFTIPFLGKIAILPIFFLQEALLWIGKTMGQWGLVQIPTIIKICLGILVFIALIAGILKDVKKITKN